MRWTLVSNGRLAKLAVGVLGVLASDARIWAASFAQRAVTPVRPEAPSSGYLPILLAFAIASAAVGLGILATRIYSKRSAKAFASLAQYSMPPEEQAPREAYPSIANEPAAADAKKTVRRIGKYDVLSELGRGAAGVVYKAEDKFIGREVVIKQLLGATPEQRERFLEGARAGVLHHQNIVTVYDTGEHEGDPYIVTEFLRGESLESRLKGEPIPLAQKLEMVREVGEGLAYAHAKGVMHRDIKPANVMVLPDGHIKIVDFGAAPAESAPDRTQTGTVIGTVAYVSPESLKGEAADGRADVWACGVMLYQMLTGRLPFPGEAISAFQKVVNEPFPPISTYLQNYPPVLDSIMERALAKNPDDRYVAEEMVSDLESAGRQLRRAQVGESLARVKDMMQQEQMTSARPMLLELQWLDPQNTEVRLLLREVQDKLSRGQRSEGSRESARRSEEAQTLQEQAREARPAQDAAEAAEAALTDTIRKQEEYRRKEIVEEIAGVIQGHVSRGEYETAAALTERALQRAPHDEVLLRLRQETQKRYGEAASRNLAEETSLQVEQLFFSDPLEAANIVQRALAKMPFHPRLLALQERVTSQLKRASGTAPQSSPLVPSNPDASQGAGRRKTVEVPLYRPHAPAAQHSETEPGTGHEPAKADVAGGPFGSQPEVGSFSLPEDEPGPPKPGSFTQMFQTMAPAGTGSPSPSPSPTPPPVPPRDAFAPQAPAPSPAFAQEAPESAKPGSFTELLRTVPSPVKGAAPPVPPPGAPAPEKESAAPMAAPPPAAGGGLTQPLGHLDPPGAKGGSFTQLFNTMRAPHAAAPPPAHEAELMREGPPAGAVPAATGSGEFTRILQASSLREAQVAAEPPVSSPAPPNEDVESDATTVGVFFATDREIQPGPEMPSFTDERSPHGKLNYGTCQVSIPKSHKTGKLERPSWLRLEFHEDVAKHIVLKSVISAEEEEFLADVAAAVTRSPARDAFVFMHGYNVSFEDAARRTGQMAYDLDFLGAPIFYSWPSRGRVAQYLRDETNITWSAPHLERFLQLLALHSGAARVHLIAHSMGSRAVCEALKNISLRGGARPALRHLVFAAPDIDADTFAELAALLRPTSEQITLYASSEDRALRASKLIHGNPRAGEPLLVLDGVDTVDASAIDTDFLAHSYFSDSWPLLSDIHSILQKDARPADRFGLRAMTHADGTYYVFRK